MRLLRFMCSNCGMEMMLEARPDRCPSCGSSAVIRRGWKLRARAEKGTKSQQESDQE